MSTIVIELDPSHGSVDDHAQRDANILQASVWSKKNGWLPAEDVDVHLQLSRDGMIGLATELLRKANAPKESSEALWELSPVEPNNVVCQLGVYLNPKSCRIIVTRNEVGPIGDLI
jgi:hypothetical protein